MSDNLEIGTMRKRKSTKPKIKRTSKTKGETENKAKIKGDLNKPTHRKTKSKRKPQKHLTKLLSPYEVLEKSKAHRKRIWQAKTIGETITILKNEIVPFWVNYEKDYPDLTKPLLRRIRLLLAEYAINYPKIPDIYMVDFRELKSWISDAERVVRRKHNNSDIVSDKSHRERKNR